VCYVPVGVALALPLSPLLFLACLAPVTHLHAPPSPHELGPPLASPTK
jgi:hypothetical protein